MDQGLLWAATASLAGLGVLFLLAEAAEPLRVATLQEVGDHPDRAVTVEGRVVSAEPARSGGMRLVLTDGDHSLAVWVRGHVAVLPGDRVEATGRLSAWRGAWELQVQRPEDVVVLAAWDAERVPVAVLANEPWAWRDANVRTLGRLGADVRGGLFLEDPAGTARLRAVGAAVREHPEGSMVEVDGQVEYDAAEGRFQLRGTRAAAVAWPGP